MPKYRKKPVVVEAIKWDGSQATYDAIKALDERNMLDPFTRDGMLRIKTWEGYFEARFGDMIIKGVKGEMYPCKPDVFEESYELV